MAKKSTSGDVATLTHTSAHDDDLDEMDEIELDAEIQNLLDELCEIAPDSYLFDDNGQLVKAEPPSRRKPSRSATSTAKRDRKAECAEKRERLQQLVNQFSAMTEDERTAAVAGGLISNVEGHTLSLRNTYLLLGQRPTVSLVGGFRQWLAKGRCVRKGERALLIAIPCTVKADADSEGAEESRTYFKTASVFDVSQTDPIEAN
jgi:hypothetical protein